jgi:hypothetical protein
MKKVFLSIAAFIAVYSVSGLVGCLWDMGPFFSWGNLIEAAAITILVVFALPYIFRKKESGKN